MRFCSILVLLLAINAIYALGGDLDIDENGRKLQDESSFSNINDVHTTHFDLELDLDYDQKVFHGKQTLHLVSNKWFLDRVVLDIRDITIHKVTDFFGRNLKYSIDSQINPNLGQKLDIQISTKIVKNTGFKVVIEYTTSQNASAVTWLTKEQTAGGKLPYMYTQCESIHCRSIAPLQDTPAIKATYNLKVTSPFDIIVRASGNVTKEYVSGKKRYTDFEMTIPVESYLLAIAGGNLVEHQLGPRTFVITEPEILQKCINELEDLENAVSTAEGYLTDYIWGTYKVLALPPSFPYGGMENPLLTFANSGLISGDKSAFRLFVHELSHSWFGNLVTNENWSNFWLNEGFTVFLERKTDTILFGEESSKVSAKLGNASMYLDMLGFGLNSNYTSLHPVMNGNHPDTSISGIPYEKGFQFLTYLESLVGYTQFENFLKLYVNTYLKKSVIVDDFENLFIKFVKTNFNSSESSKILKKIDWKKWIYGTGLPPVAVDLETEVYNTAIRLAHDYLEKGSLNKTDIEEYKAFDIVLKSVFLTELVTNINKVSKNLAEKIDNDLNCSLEQFIGVQMRWQQIAILTGLEAAPFAEGDQFVGKIGRTALILPVYKAMIQMNKQEAWQIFQKHYIFYHPITRGIINDAFGNSDSELVSS